MGEKPIYANSNLMHLARLHIQWMISQILIVLSDTEEILNSDSDEENKLLFLTKMGYSEAEALITMERCGPDSSITELKDFICADQMAKVTDAFLPVEDQITQRTLPEDAIGPPYFYYENVALAPVGVWTKMSRKCQIDRKDCKDLEAYDDEPPLSVQNDAEVTFYCLGISLKTDVQELNDDQLEQLMSRFSNSTLLSVASSVTTLLEEINIIRMN
ncbi:hypothetical protein F3Y22_tig00110633pilonHSYRG00122 [Hibiscus syriacus]|uniref:DNA (Cytosine-5)-methyltransferase DRM1/2 n=1 Tax=Hibiscus syriacus TaxID=106335 RepID=A0A6A2ZZ15_HIBSY|nr:hypothetical protein F3Y22_tig00110633pilonHSYRG00122 [Hibiscus syriacus]